MERCTGNRSRIFGLAMATVFLLVCYGCDRGPGGKRDRLPRAADVNDMTELKDMVLIPGIDAFSVGSRQYPPQQTVSIDAFRISPCEVTQALYECVMRNNPSAGEPGDMLPVQNVSWIDAVRFCNRLSEVMELEPCYDEQSGYSCDLRKSGYRLPLSSEWEYACRGDSTSPYFWGANQSDEFCVPPLTPDELKNIDNKLLYSAARPVKSCKPNAFGLYDMIGNVAEWCEDDFAGNSAWRTYRGGSWEHHDWEAFESKWNSGMPRDQAMSTLGFRIVRRP